MIKDQLSELSIEIKDLENRSIDIEDELSNKRHQRDELIAQKILNEKMLSSTNWDLHIDDKRKRKIRLTYNNQNSSGIAEVKNLIITYTYDENVWFEITDGIHIEFDDTDVSLSFDQINQVMPFVRKNNMTINGSGIRDRLNDLKREVAALETICHQFNI